MGVESSELDGSNFAKVGGSSGTFPCGGLLGWGAGGALKNLYKKVLDRGSCAAGTTTARAGHGPEALSGSSAI